MHRPSAPLVSHPLRVRWLAALLTAPLVLGLCGGCKQASENERSSPATASGAAAETEPSEAVHEPGADVAAAGATAASNRAVLSADEVRLRAAVLLGSCVPDDGVTSILADMTWEIATEDELFDRILARAPACLAGKTNGCAGVAECTGVSVTRTGPCAPSCDGTVFEACDDSLKFRFDCAVTEMECSVEDRGCVAPDAQGEPCDGESFVERCVENRPEVCLSRVERGVECPFGTTCEVAESYGQLSALCRGTGDACAMQSTSPMRVDAGPGLGCQGAETLDLCVGFKTASLTCADIGPGFTCQTHGSTSFCGLAADCDPFETPTHCDGTEMVVCNAGRLDRIDCTALGFSACDTNRRGALCKP